MSDLNNYISGEPLTKPIPDCSVGEYFISRLRSFPRDHILQMDAQSGFSETASDVLKKTLKVCEGLKALGLGQNDTFCLVTRNSSDVTSVILGVLTLGGTLAPLDPEYKTREFIHMFENVIHPTAIVCEEDVVSKITAALESTKRLCKIIVIAEKEKVKQPHVAFEDLLRIDVDVDKYVPPTVKCPATKIGIIIPTSGSTGLPKGVGITQRNILYQCLVHRQIKKLQVKSSLVMSSFFWITAFLCLFDSLENGTKRIYLREVTIDNILQSIHKRKPDWSLMSAPVFKKLLMHPDIQKFDLSSIKYIYLAGCAISEKLIDMAKTIWKGQLPFMNCYGTSEATGCISTTEIGQNLMSVGKPVPDLKVKIVDLDTGSALAANQRGEIMISSPGIMKGYVNNETETMATLKDGWCHTGDLGYYDEQGNLYVVDRIKDVIKCEYGQVSICEVEQVIAEIPGIMDVGVVGLFPDSEKCCLVAFIIKSKDSELTEEDVKNHLKRNLADFKHPKYFKFVSEMPRTRMGKLRRNDLKEMAATFVV